MFFFCCNSWFLFNPWNLRETSSQEFFIAFAGLDLFAIVLNQLTNLYHFAILDLLAIHDLFASTAIPYPIAILDLLCYPWSLRKGLFARILHRFCARTANLYLFAILALQFLISSREQLFFASSHLPNPWTLYNSWSLRKNLSLRNLWSLRKNSSSQFFTSSQPLISLIFYYLFARTALLHLFARTFSPAIFIVFASFVLFAICLLMGRHTCISPNG